MQTWDSYRSVLGSPAESDGARPHNPAQLVTLIMKAKKPKPSVTIIGAGRLGQALAIALARSGYPIKALVARRASRAEKAVASLPRDRSIQALGIARLSELPPTDVVLITTPDDAIHDTARRLATLETANSQGRIGLHTSGALSSEVLSALAEVGFSTGSLHPLVSVSDPVAGAKGLIGASYCIEGDKGAATMARKIVKDFHGKSFAIAPKHKALYHAAALTAAGHLTALIDVAIEMLASCGLSRKVAQQVLMPLVESAVENIEASTPAKALTGTFARGDIDTVRRHLEALSGTEQAEALQFYKLLGLRSIQLAGSKGIDRKVIVEIVQLLSCDQDKT